MLAELDAKLLLLWLLRWPVLVLALLLLLLLLLLERLAHESNEETVLLFKKVLYKG